MKKNNRAVCAIETVGKESTKCLAGWFRNRILPPFFMEFSVFVVAQFRLWRVRCSIVYLLSERSVHKENFVVKQAARGKTFR